jgi:hypothetical protein
MYHSSNIYILPANFLYGMSSNSQLFNNFIHVQNKKRSSSSINLITVSRIWNERDTAVSIARLAKVGGASMSEESEFHEQDSFCIETTQLVCAVSGKNEHGQEVRIYKGPYLVYSRRVANDASVKTNISDRDSEVHVVFLPHDDNSFTPTYYTVDKRNTPKTYGIEECLRIYRDLPVAGKEKPTHFRQYPYGGFELCMIGNDIMIISKAKKE